jgi:hypothetical protein
MSSEFLEQVFMFGFELGINVDELWVDIELEILEEPMTTLLFEGIVLIDFITSLEPEDAIKDEVEIKILFSVIGIFTT